jgi:4-hydroxybenzoate polyprenyltransferase
MTQTIRALIRLSRPKQWVKNFFLFAPLIFSKHLFDWSFVSQALLGFALFSVLSSVVYIVNDITDREADRLHPTKRDRPVASGAVSIAQATVFATVLMVVVVLLGQGLPLKFQILAGLYFVINTLYSFWLKRVTLVDVFMIAAGFMIRVVAGAFVIGVMVSHWLVLCTLFVSLFLAISKRRGELLLFAESGASSGREVLREYDLAFIDQLITIAAAGMAISYALYTVAQRTVLVFGTENLIFTTVFVLFGIFRYLFLMKKRRVEDNPMSLLLTDGVMMLNIAAWFACCVLIIYYDDILQFVKS